MSKSKTPLAYIGNMSHGTQEERKNAMRHRPEKPKCPVELSDRAKVEWDYIVPKLDELGVIGKIDRAVLAEYCDAYATFIYMAELIKNLESLTFETNSGYRQQVPEVSILNNAAKRMLIAGDKLGLNPSARAGVSAGSGSVDDEGILD